MENYIIVAILVLVVGGAVCYILKKKKQGAKCIGCPHSETCGKCNCHSSNRII